MDPGPINHFVLYNQEVHWSLLIWEGNDPGELHCRRHEASFYHNSVLDARIIPYLQQSGFYGVTRLSFISLDWHLIIVFIERWCPKTHTFHVHQGECTITLHDVSIILGLSIDGVAVNDNTCLDFREVCATLLGVLPEDKDISEQRLRLTWLIEQLKLCDYFGLYFELLVQWMWSLIVSGLVIV